MNIGEKIKAELKKQKITQKQLASKSGVSEASISYFCNGKRSPQISTLVQIAEALNTTVESLVREGSGRPTAEWIYTPKTVNAFRCSHCGHELVADDMTRNGIEKLYPICDYCGAQMSRDEYERSQNEER